MDSLAWAWQISHGRCMFFLIGELLTKIAARFLQMNGQDLPFEPPKRGSVYQVPSGIRPVLQRTAIEVNPGFPLDCQANNFIIYLFN